jgi:anaerobic ribonucleoside-triphosphate reductase activating protein
VVKVKIAGVERCSVVDGPGLRTVVFAQGCPRSCPGCHNPASLDPEGGSWRELDELVSDVCSERGIQGVTFSGGEPFMQAQAFAELARRFKDKGLSIVTFSGYTYEELKDMSAADEAVAALLHATDILIDGPYRQEERNLSLAFRGSGNQRIIDMAKSRECGELVLSELHFR